jgi:hypothetical protein
VVVRPGGGNRPSELDLALFAAISPWNTCIGFVDGFALEFVAKLVEFVEI